MRILVITDEHPWGPTYGYRIRLQNVVRALTSLGTVDLFVVAPDDGSVDTSVPAAAGLHRAVVVPVPGRRGLGRRGLTWLVRRLPWRIAWRDWDVARRHLDDWAEPPYDLAWYSHLDTYAGVGRVDARTVIVDLDNLDDQALTLALETGAPTTEDQRRGRAVRVRNALDAIDARRWRRLQRLAAATADTVVVCSEVDRDRLGTDKARIVVNGYDGAPVEPATPVRPVVSMFGRLSYPPNADGATHLVRDVLPGLRRLVPDVQVRLVGRLSPDVAALAGDGVTVVGEVEDLTDELARARVIAVPLRVGSGTRIKILEAFARRIPVVSTTLGCEGLDVEDGRQLLIADDAGGFAAACARLLTDDALRARLTDAAAEVHASRYRWEHVRQDVAAVVADVTGEGRRR